MFTLAALALLAFVVVPAAAWAFGLVFKVLGWTMRVVFGVLLLPLWIVGLCIGGLALSLQFIIPIALVLFVISLITEN